jgi:hypothetical protein
MNKPTEIDAGFRTITLAYKNQAELTLYELKLIDKYKALHANRDMAIKEISLFAKNQKQLKQYVKEAKRIVKQTVLKLNHLMELDTLYANAKKDSKEYQKVQKLATAFGKHTPLIHEQNVKSKTMFDIIAVQWDEIEKINEAFTRLAKEYNEFCKEFNQHNGNYDLDIVQYVADGNQFNAFTDKCQADWDEQMDLYNDLIHDEYNTVPPMVEEINKMMAGYKPNLYVMHDTRPKHTATQTHPAAIPMKQYYIAKGHPLFAKHEKELDVAAVKLKGISISIPWAMVEAKDISAVTDIICVSQHKTEWINNLVFGINLTFDDMPLTEPMHTHSNIMANTKILAWMAKLGENPMSMFFLMGDEMRNATLHADLILMEQASVEQYPEEEMMKFGFKVEHLQLIVNRLYNACITFVEYCYQTPIDTQTHVNLAIQTNMLSKLESEDGKPLHLFTYEQVLEEWKNIYKR